MAAFLAPEKGAAGSLWGALGAALGSLVVGKRADVPVAAPKAPDEAPRASTVHVPKVEPQPSPTYLDTMARTLWGEARGEPIEGQIAVAWVIRNRAENGRWWGRDIEGVCRKPWQFSCWHDQPGIRLPSLDKNPRFSDLKNLCREVLEGKYTDPTMRSDHYCTTAVAPKTAWAKTRKPVVTIGAHAFYRLELKEPSA